MTATVRQIAGYERWVSLQEYADYLGMTKRWVEFRVAEGLPSRLVGGRRRVRVSVADEWLLRNGQIEEDG